MAGGIIVEDRTAHPVRRYYAGSMLGCQICSTYDVECAVAGLNLPGTPLGITFCGECAKLVGVALVRAAALAKQGRL